MSMQYWVRSLACKLRERFNIEHEVQKLDNGDIRLYLQQRLATIPVQEFLSGISTEILTEEAKDESDEDA